MQSYVFFTLKKTTPLLKPREHISYANLKPQKDPSAILPSYLLIVKFMLSL